MYEMSIISPFSLSPKEQPFESFTYSTVASKTAYSQNCTSSTWISTKS